MEKKEPLVRYGDADLLEFKRIIDLKLQDAKLEIQELKDQIQHMADSTDHEASYDEPGDSDIKEHLMTLLSRQQKFARDLELARDRILNKTYGICRQTGNLIRKERLLAVPHATLSIEAKNQQLAQ